MFSFKKLFHIEVELRISKRINDNKLIFIFDLFRAILFNVKNHRHNHTSSLTRQTYHTQLRIIINYKRVHTCTNKK